MNKTNLNYLIISFSIICLTLITCRTDRGLTAFGCCCPKMSEFILSATCKGPVGDSKETKIDISKCIANYHGEISTIKPYSSLPPYKVQNCSTDGILLNCKCEQLNSEFTDCALYLDEFLWIDQGELDC